MAATPNLPYEVKTKIIGRILQEEYGKKDPNTPINYFMILLGRRISQKLKDSEQEFAESLEKLGMNVWRIIDDGWMARKLLFIKYDDRFSDERQREYAVNVKVLEDLKQTYKRLVDNTEVSVITDVHIILTRACLYYKEDGQSQQQSDQPDQPDQPDQKLPLITTDEIGYILKNKYSTPVQVAIDFFYLFIQVEENENPKNVHETASPILKDMPGEWRILDEADWPGVYLGHYPKTSGFMTEREREMSLNEKVREPLIKKMKPKIRKMLMDANEAESEAKVHVIITRACDYNKNFC